MERAGGEGVVQGAVAGAAVTASVDSGWLVEV